MIYFIQREDDSRSPVKIGYTMDNPRGRLTSLQTASPYRLIILRVVDGDRRTEASAAWSVAWSAGSAELQQQADDIRAEIPTWPGKLI